MRQVMDDLKIPDGMGAIVRTAGVGRAVEELQWDLDNLKSQWDQIDAATKDRPAPYLVYRESDAVTPPDSVDSGRVKIAICVGDPTSGSSGPTGANRTAYPNRSATPCAQAANSARGHSNR